jgi:tetratricopeptide (TPR) repeat protein
VDNSRKTLARDLLRLDKLEGAREVAEAEIGIAENPWPYRMILLELQRLQGLREEALQELNHLEQLDPPAQEDIESSIGIKKLRGYYSGLLGRYETSHQWLDEAEALALEANLIETRAEVLLCQAMILFLQQDYVASDRIFRVVLDLSQQIGGWYFRGSALWGIGKNLMIQTHYEEAIPWLQQSLVIFEGVRAELAMALVWSELAVCHLGLGNDQLSLDLLRSAEDVQLKAGTVANYQVVLANIGNVYLYRNDYLTAISYYRRALALSREIKDPVSIRKWTYNINLAYMKMRAALENGSQSFA